VLGPVVVAREIDPPQVVRDAHAQDSHQDRFDAEVDPAEAEPDGDDRLADRDDHDQAVPLDEVPGRDRVHLDVVRMTRGDLHQRRGDPAQMPVRLR
jgi:hypothetical protein